MEDGYRGPAGPGRVKAGAGWTWVEGELDTDQGPHHRVGGAADAGHDLGELLPELVAHAAVDGKVERAGEAHEGVDDEDDEVGRLVIHPVPRLINMCIVIFSELEFFSLFYRHLRAKSV